MKCLAKLYKKKGHMRIVAVSATIPNPYDFAVWLDVN
jgi:replicative superfamily II helicase